MMDIPYYKPTPSSARTSCIGKGRVLLVYKHLVYYKPIPLFRADVCEIAHGLIIRTIRYGSLVGNGLIGTMESVFISVCVVSHAVAVTFSEIEF